MSKLRVLLKHLTLATLYIGLFCLIVGGWLYVDLATQQADLRLWHTVDLEGEYKGKDDPRVRDYASYVALEPALFEELRREIHGSGDPTATLDWSRFKAGGRHDPSTWDHDWNRSMELAAENAVGGALLLHGATDSPYSMHALAERLNAHGWHVLVPRFPGHGTAPAGLTDFEWQDISQIVDLATVDLRQKIGPARPLVAIGYSTGGVLAIEQALADLEEEAEASFDRIVTLSPAMGISPIAALAKTQLRLSRLLGIPKLAWAGIEPEYDPYKYNSFSVNAGDQVYELASSVSRRIERLADSTGVVRGLPPILSFVSVVDATVNTRDTIGFYDQLGGGGGHELVIFDVNRTQLTDDFLHNSSLAILDTLPERDARNYALTIIGNLSDTSTDLLAWDDVRQREGAVGAPFDWHWPPTVYSLSHVALPFPLDDPLYGLNPEAELEGPSLGNVHLRGERGLFVISAANLARLRCNPFFEYVATRILASIDDIPVRSQ